MDGGVTGRRWPWFVAWAAVGACIGLSLSALALVTLPLAVILTVAFRRRSRRRELLGVVAGVGIAVAFFGSLHAEYEACSSTRFGGHGGIVYSCGGVDGLRWLVVGLAAAIAALMGYWYMAHRASTSTTAHATLLHD
jgi:formate hydrogenlyase subunit 3/multisubunit Na+/H+ antiporter MnhD subunit